jgi:outer membrane lipoprotein-sorting protein
VIAGLIIAIAGGTAIAVAAIGSGPVPRRTTLARAIHQAMAAPAVTGISARISFTNRLISSSNIQGTDPILTGASGRLWLSTTDHRFRLELQADNGDAQVVVDNGSFWIYDPSANTVYKGSLPSGSRRAGKPDKYEPLPSIAQIQADIGKVVQHAHVTGPIPGDIAGQPAYTVRISPRHDGSLLGAAEFGWDAMHGVPLRFAIYASGDSSPVLELKATDISYGQIPASDFNAGYPRDAKVVQIATPTAAASNADKRLKDKHRAPVTGVAAVAGHLHFGLAAPAKLVGLKRQSVMLLESKDSPGALVAYGQGLGGIVVLEQPAGAAGKLGLGSSGSGGDRHGLSLPTVSINGATGQELDTALGTLVRFTRGGVTYTVVGSVQPYAAERAARSL